MTQTQANNFKRHMWSANAGRSTTPAVKYTSTHRKTPGPGQDVNQHDRWEQIGHDTHRMTTISNLNIDLNRNKKHLHPCQNEAPNRIRFNLKTAT